MPGQAKRFRQEQKDAIAEAILGDRKLTGRECAEAAATGNLTEDLEPFAISHTRCIQLAAIEREKRAGETLTALAKQDPTFALERLLRRAISATDHQVATVERKAARGNANLKELTSLATVLSRLWDANKAWHANPKTTRTAATEPKSQRKAQEYPTKADELLAAYKRSDRDPHAPSNGAR